MFPKFCEAFTMPMLIVCVPLAQARHLLSLGELSLMDRTCTQVMGLGRRDGLPDAVAARDEGMALRSGLAGSRGLAPLQLYSRSACWMCPKPPPDELQAPAIARTGRPHTETRNSFYNAAPRVRWSRERYACAQLGLVPRSVSFG